MKTIATLLAAGGLLFVQAAKAEWNIDFDAESRPRISGFGTLGLATSDQSQASLTRDLADRKGITGNSLPLSADSRLGLQLDMIVNSEWSATVQAVVKDRPAQTIEESLQWAFVSYRPMSTWLTFRRVTEARRGHAVFGYSSIWPSEHRPAYPARCRWRRALQAAAEHPFADSFSDQETLTLGFLQ